MALDVFTFHNALLTYNAQQIWPLTFAVLWYFCLSGFLITRLLVAPTNRSIAQQLYHFYLRRALRIFPAYYFVVLLAALNGLPYLSWFVSYSFNFKLFALSNSLDRGPFHSYLGQGDANMSHLWSLCTEEQYYLLYPLALLSCPRRWRLPALTVLALTATPWRYYCCNTFVSAYYGPLPLSFLDFILFGSVAALLEQSPLSQRLKHPALLYLGLALWGFLLTRSYDPHYYRGLMTPPWLLLPHALAMAAIILGLAGNPQSWIARLLALSPLVALGKISYSAYLIHPLMNGMVDQILSALPFLKGPLIDRALVGPVAYFGAAYLMWVTFEGRLNRLKDKFAPLKDQDA